MKHNIYSNKIKNLFFLETLDQASQINKNNKNEIIVALNTKVQSFLKLKKISYFTSLDFFDTTGHKYVLNTSENIIEELKNHFNYKDEKNIADAYSHSLFFNLRFYIRYWLKNLYIIKKTINEFKPKKIFVSESKDLWEINCDLKSDDLLFSYILKKFLKHNKIKIQVRVQPAILTQSNNINFYKKLKQFINFFLNIFFTKLFQILPIKKKIIYFLEEGYNMDQFINKISINNKKDLLCILQPMTVKKLFKNIVDIALFRKIYFYPQIHSIKNNDVRIDKSIELLCKKIDQKLSHQNFRKNFKYCDFSKEIQIFLSSQIKKHLVHLNTETKFYDELIARKNNKFYFPQFWVDRGYSLGEIAKKNNFPSVLISHATHVQKKNDASKEWANHGFGMESYRYVLAQSPYAKEFLKNKNIKNSQIIDTGPILFSNLKKKEEINSSNTKLLGKNLKNKIILLHASTPKPDTSTRPIVFETIDEYIFTINNLIRLVDRYKGRVFLIIKFRETEFLMYNDFVNLLYKSNNYEIVTTGKVLDFISFSNLLVSYSSTVIEEALNCKTPVLLLDLFKRYSHLHPIKNGLGTQGDKKPFFYCKNIKESEFVLNNFTRGKFKKNQFDYNNYIFKVDKNLNWINKIK